MDQNERRMIDDLFGRLRPAAVRLSKRCPPSRNSVSTALGVEWAAPLGGMTELK
jgi:hypothetical protein